MKPNNLYQKITDQILALMEEHGSDWTRPWTAHGVGMPTNVVTGAQYRGVNVLLLGLAAAKSGFATSLWGTFRQWRSKGGCVRKGEKGTLGVFYKSMTIEEGEEEKTVPVLKHFYLFNADQVDGVEFEPEESIPEPERIANVEQFIANTGAEIHQGGDKACYSPIRDRIRVPVISAFANNKAYYASLLHELGHWTGHWSRLDRKAGMKSRFSDEAYAMEELVAELGAAFLSIQLGIDHEPRSDHAKYLNHWVRVLKDDSRAFSSAASKAQAVADYLMGLQGQAEAA